MASSSTWKRRNAHTHTMYFTHRNTNTHTHMETQEPHNSTVHFSCTPISFIVKSDWGPSMLAVFFASGSHNRRRRCNKKSFETYYCNPLVCVFNGLGRLAVLRLYTNKQERKKEQTPSACRLHKHTTLHIQTWSVLRVQCPLRECRSIRARIFMVTLLLHTTRVRSQLLGRVSGVAALVTNKQRSTTTVRR